MRLVGSREPGLIKELGMVIQTEGLDYIKATWGREKGSCSSHMRAKAMLANAEGVVKWARLNHTGHSELSLDLILVILDSH